MIQSTADSSLISASFQEALTGLFQVDTSVSIYQDIKQNISAAAVLFTLGYTGERRGVYWAFQCPVGKHTKGNCNFIVCPNGKCQCMGCRWVGDVTDLWYELNPCKRSWSGPFETAWCRKFAARELMEWHAAGKFKALPAGAVCSVR